MNTTNIYTKLKEIRKEIRQIKKEEVNKFQNYNYVSEYTYFSKINPLLEKHGLIMTFSDSDAPLVAQKEGKEWSVHFQKQITITDVGTEKSLTFKHWGAGQNTDIAKAKGSADTYAVKYFLQKFFMIPTSDKSVLDPDIKSNETEVEEKSGATTSRPLTEEEKKQANEVLERNGFDALPEKCFKCDHEFSVSLLTEAKTKTGEIKKLCLSCYEEAVKRMK